MTAKELKTVACVGLAGSKVWQDVVCFGFLHFSIYCISICSLFFVPLVTSWFFVVLCCSFVFLLFLLCFVLHFLVAVCRFLYVFVVCLRKRCFGSRPTNDLQTIESIAAAAPPPPLPANQQKCLLYSKQRVEPEQTNFKGLYLNRAEIRHRGRNFFLPVSEHPEACSCQLGCDSCGARSQSN